MKKWTSVIRTSWVDSYEFSVDEDDGFILDDSIGGSKLKLQLVSAKPPDEAHEKRARCSPLQVAGNREPGNEDAGEGFTTAEQELRRILKVRGTRQCFENISRVAIEHPKTMEKFMSS